MQEKSVQGKMAALILGSYYGMEGNSLVVVRDDTYADPANRRAILNMSDMVSEENIHTHNEASFLGLPL